MVPHAAVPTLVTMPTAIAHAKSLLPPMILAQRIAINVCVKALVRPYEIGRRKSGVRKDRIAARVRSCETRYSEISQ